MDRCALCGASLGEGHRFYRMALDRAETAGLSPADIDAIRRYTDSGESIWDRDLSLLDGVTKFELEAMDPPQVRDLLAGAIGRVLDLGQLETAMAEQEDQRDALRESLAPLTDDEDGGEPS